MIGVVEERAEGMDVRRDDKEFIANFYKHALVGLMLDWVKNDMKEDPHKIIHRLTLLVSGNIASALERYRTDIIEA